MLSHPTPTQLLMLYGAAIVAFAWWKRRELSSILGVVGRPAGYFVTLSVVILVLCQAYSPGRAFYPWVSWAMYSEPEPPRTLWVFESERRSGAVEPFTTRGILRGPNVRPMMHNLYGRASLLEEPEADRTTLEREFAELLAALRELDLHHHPDDPIVRIRLERCELRGSPPWTRKSLECGPTRSVWSAGPAPREEQTDAP